MESLTLENKVTLKEAYLIMFDFLNKYWERTNKPDDIGGLLGDLSLGDTDKGKEPMDDPDYSDWLDSAKIVLEQEQTDTGYRGADIVFV